MSDTKCYAISKNTSNAVTKKTKTIANYRLIKEWVILYIYIYNKSAYRNTLANDAHLQSCHVMPFWIHSNDTAQGFQKACLRYLQTLLWISPDFSGQGLSAQEPLPIKTSVVVVEVWVPTRTQKNAWSAESLFRRRVKCQRHH